MDGTRRTKGGRPVIRLPRSAFEWAGELVAAGAVVAMAVVLLINWADLPERVPTHFGISGQADSWGRRELILLPPVVALVLYLGLTILSGFPHAYNYPWPITEDNAATQYRLARTMIVWLKAVITAFFSLLLWQMIQVAQGDASRLNPLLIPAFILSLIGTLGVYLWAAARSA